MPALQSSVSFSTYLTFQLINEGKTLQVVALVHTLLHHPALRQPCDEDAKPFLHKILLIVPVNTIVNWANEFDKWTGKLQHSVRYFDYSSVRMASRPKIVQNWSKLGGVLLIGAEAFTRLAKKETDAAVSSECYRFASMLPLY